MGSLANSEVGITPSGVVVYDSTYLEGDVQVLADLDVEVWATESRGIGSGLIVIFNAPVDTESSTCSVQQTRGGAFPICYRTETSQRSDNILAPESTRPVCGGCHHHCTGVFVILRTRTLGFGRQFFVISDHCVQSGPRMG